MAHQKISIADDDPAIRGLFRRLLEAQPGLAGLLARRSNGVDAVEQVARSTPGSRKTWRLGDASRKMALKRPGRFRIYIPAFRFC